MKEKNKICICITKEVHKELSDIGQFRETYSDIIARVLKERKINERRI